MGFQIAAAIGQLGGVRVLTEVLPPSVFGETILWLGMVALVAVSIANPTMQALLRYYPEYALKGQGATVRSVVRQQLIKLATWLFILLFFITAFAAFSGAFAVTDLGLMSALVILEIARLYNTSILNATASHRAFGVRAVLEAWGRPLVAYTATYFLGTNTTAVLVGYCGASVLTLLSMMRFVPSDPPVSSLAPDRRALVAQVWEYTLPLLPLGIVGWLSGMVDRYLIGVLLSPADAGLYAAMYGLGSRPLLMFGSAVELTIRPAYQRALVGAGSLVAQGYIRKWAWAIVFGSSVVIATIAITHQWLASLMLGAQYRSVSYLLPWITGGYALLLLSHITTRVCYANEATSRVFLAELTGGLSATLVGFLCIKEAGLSGAAVAVLIYNALQLLVSYLAARPWLHLTAFKP